MNKKRYTQLDGREQQSIIGTTPELLSHQENLTLTGKKWHWEKGGKIFVSFQRKKRQKLMSRYSITTSLMFDSN